ncbi:hypothetical protein SDC9_108723 [bioreactor metagenome]|uniref:Lipoyl-binding domain-containing protein n=1 Tax=bioreactor metagenome TaxID=1076179 RepID=A0A645B8S6_9ZZZZ
MVKLVEVQKTDLEGNKTLVFEVNGNRREIKMFDKAYGQTNKVDPALMADPGNINEIGASIPGIVSKIVVAEGDEVKENQSLIIIEAMKMETNISALVSGKIEKILVKEGQQIKSGQLLIEIA